MSSAGARIVVGALALVVVVCAGCPGETCEEKADLVAMDGWTLVAADDDPFGPADRPACGEDRVRMEPFGVGGPIALDIDTGFGCGWATAKQRLAEDLEPGDRLNVHVWVETQTEFAGETSTVDALVFAELALAFDDETFWSTSVQIPVSAYLEGASDAPIEKTIPAGTEVFFHLGNHGANTWSLVELSRVRDAPCP